MLWALELEALVTAWMLINSVAVSVTTLLVVVGMQIRECLILSNRIWNVLISLDLPQASKLCISGLRKLDDQVLIYKFGTKWCL